MELIKDEYDYGACIHTCLENNEIRWELTFQKLIFRRLIFLKNWLQQYWYWSFS